MQSSAADSGDVYVRRFDAAGVALGPEVRVNVTTAGKQDEAAVAMSDDGRFAVTWRNNAKVYTRVYDASGAAVTGEITAYAKKNVAATPRGIAMDADGDFAILIDGRSPGPAWQSFQSPTYSMQRFNSQGQAQGSAISVGTTNHVNGGASIGIDAAGATTAFWQDATNIYARRWSASGQKIGNTVALVTGGGQMSAAMNRAGDIVVAWETFNPQSAAAQTFRPSGTTIVPISEPFDFAGGREEYNTAPNFYMTIAAPALDDAGNVFLAASRNNDIVLSQYTFTGTFVSETIVNTTTAGDQKNVSVGVNSAGQAVIAWSGNGPGDDQGVFARCYDAATASYPGDSGGAETALAADGVDAVFALDSDDDELELLG
jgi:hypothetical protein